MEGIDELDMVVSLVLFSFLPIVGVAVLVFVLESLAFNCASGEADFVVFFTTTVLAFVTARGLGIFDLCDSQLVVVLALATLVGRLVLLRCKIPFAVFSIARVLIPSYLFAAGAVKFGVALFFTFVLSADLRAVSAVEAAELVGVDSSVCC